MDVAQSGLKLLFVEDDPVLGRALTQALSECGFECALTVSGKLAMRLLDNALYQVVIVDMALQDAAGLAVVQQARESNAQANILILTPLADRRERLAGLEAGADDFVIKPFTLEELRARLEGVLVRAKARSNSVLEVGPLYMDLTARKARREDRLLALTPTEFRILEILLRNEGKAVTRQTLYDYLWQPNLEGATNVIEVHMNRLRNKLSNGGAETQMIFTVRGSGYVLRCDPEAARSSQPVLTAMGNHRR